jgi:pimeloyl-ACP methyl ester carboxylesterase
MSERAVLFGRNKTLVGILTEPDFPPDPSLPAVVLFNGGLIHRVGPSRVYVKLARRLARMGFVVLRFDLSGIGDSSARLDNLPFEQSVPDDAQQALDYLARTRGIKRFITAGHCAGSLHAFRVAMQDNRVASVILINSEGGEDSWKAYDRRRKTSRYYENYYGKGALTSADKWKKFFTGRANYRSIARNVVQNILWNKVLTLSFRVKNVVTGRRRATQYGAQIKAIVEGMHALAQRNTPILIVYSQGSSGLQRTQLLVGSELHELSAAEKLKLEIIPQADHTFTLLASQEKLAQIVESWCSAFNPESAVLPAY